MRSRFLCALLLVSPLGTPAAGADDAAPRSLVLPAQWNVQPAARPDVPPREGDWGSNASKDWRSEGASAAGTTWEKAPRTQIHSLWYQQEVTIPAEWRGRRVVADFRRIEGDAILFLNGARVSELLRPGGEVDLSAQARPGARNLLRVFLTRDYTGISRGFEADPLRHLSRAIRNPLPMERWPMGITAPVTLTALPRPAAITDVFAIPSWRRRTLTLEVEVDADTPTAGLALDATVLDAAGRKALSLHAGIPEVPAGRSVQRLSAPWPKPIPWELDGPYLYRARVALTQAGRNLDSPPATRFGFREIWTEGRQLMMNGHPSRWRLAFGPGALGGRGSVPFYRLMGYNVFQIQPHRSRWWRDWSETPLEEDAFLDDLDAVGAGITIPALSTCYLGTALLTDPRVQADYDREMRLWIRRYRNHPCVLAWVVGMNTYCPREVVHADHMGRRPEPDLAPQVQIIEAACRNVRRHDPTRLAFSHADGSSGDISTANCYLNFVPLQEREEWPMAWAHSGNMPYSAIEFGPPFTANFWKWKQFLMTEYLAMYFGDRAYREEGEAALCNTIAAGMANKDHTGDMRAVDLAQCPLYWEFQRLFVVHTDRAWRTWGVNGGWNYWNWNLGYGDPPGSTGNVFTRYASLNGPMSRRPSWANPNFDIHREAMRPLLAYIAGSPCHTDKTHAYYAGESVRKQIAVVWDGPGRRSLTAQWALSLAHKPLLRGSASIVVNAGDIRLAPISFTAPATAARRSLTLSLTVKEGASVVATDAMALQVFDRPRRPAGGWPRGILLWDPAGESAPWLAALGVQATPWRPGVPLSGAKLLIIGRQAIQPGTKLPYAPAEIAAGLNVLVLEQRPEAWEGIGLRSLEVMPRMVFPRDRGSAVLGGLQPEDLAYWRGTPDLLPQFRQARAYPRPRAFHWTNTHAVASAVLQIPHVVGFTPILAAEFDMDYSPLLEWRTGRGKVLFCSLDLTGRVGSDPAATLLACNLVREAARPAPPTRATVYAGGPVGRALLERLQVGFDSAGSLDNPARTLLVLGEGDPGIAAPALRQFVDEGGLVLSLPKSAEDLARDGLKCAAKSLARAPAEGLPWPLRAVGPSLLRWRRPLDVAASALAGQPAGAQVAAGGVCLIRPARRHERRAGGDAGARVYLQVGPEMLSAAVAADAQQRQAVLPSIARLTQLTAQILTNMGAAPSVALHERLASVRIAATYETMAPWQVLGPFVAAGNGAGMMDAKLPAETDAIAGRTDPGLGYPGADGRRCQWRPSLSSDTRGFVNLGTTGRNALAACYAVRHVHSDTARTARLRLGVDYWLQVWVNGKVVHRVVEAHGGAAPAQYRVDVPLRAGDNVVTLKVGAGSAGFGFWGEISRPGGALELAPAPSPALYDAALDGPDPYTFIYW